MSTVPSIMPLATSETESQITTWRSRAKDYIELTKPRIGMMALVTVAVGFVLGSYPEFRWAALLHTLIGAGAVAAGGSVLNCWLERRADGKMNRTRNRAVVSGRIHPIEALNFGLTLTILGTAYLYFALPSPAAAIAAALTAILYVVVYTPLKRITVWNTVVGAIPGALPPVIGWCGATGGMAAPGWALFAILFVWQLPHFYSIAYLHREDYARGGMRMLPVIDSPDGLLTGFTTAATALLLLFTTALPYALGATGWVYLVLSLPAAVWFLLRCIRFARNRNSTTARGVLRGSLVYLLAVMAVFVFDGIILKRLMG
jgi:heme o synthase